MARKLPCAPSTTLTSPIVRALRAAPFSYRVTDRLLVLTVLASGVFRSDATALSFATVRWHGIHTLRVWNFEWSVARGTTSELRERILRGGSTRLPWPPSVPSPVPRGLLASCLAYSSPDAGVTFVGAPTSRRGPKVCDQPLSFRPLPIEEDRPHRLSRLAGRLGDSE